MSGKLTGEGPLERLESAVKSRDVIDMLSGASSGIDRRFYLNEVLKSRMFCLNLTSGNQW